MKAFKSKAHTVLLRTIGVQNVKYLKGPFSTDVIIYKTFKSS